MRGHIVPLKILGGVAVPLLVLTVLTGEPVFYALLFLSGLVFFSLQWFLRDPERATPQGDGLVTSAADGRVCSLERVRENLYLGGEGIAVGVYLSLFDVHINRIPVSGVVRLISHRSGRFFPAFQKRASAYNEQQIIGIESDRGRILVKQIAGSVARRIVCHLRLGDVVRAGDRFGMIKLGSRVELILPPHTEIKVKLGDRVRAGETIIGVMR